MSLRGECSTQLELPERFYPIITISHGTVDSVSGETLFGRQRDRTRLTLGLATAIFIGMVLIGTYARGRWMQDVMRATTEPVVFVILVGGGLTIWNAYWNDGLLLSWLLLFSLITPWLIHYNLQFGIYEPFVSAGYVTLAFIVSTSGYLIGVGVRHATRDDTSRGVAERYAAVLSSTPRQTARWLLLVSGLVVIPAVLVYVAEPYRLELVSVVYPVVLFYPIGDLTVRTVIGVGLIMGWIGIATWPAYRGYGVIMSWGVLFAPMFGTILTYSLLEPFFGPDLTPSIVDDVLIAALVSVPLAVILGALGFVTGVLIRRAVATQQRGHERIRA